MGQAFGGALGMLSKVVADIIAERQRLAASGLPAKERRYRPSDLPKAAAAYALAGVQRYADDGWPELFWPWSRTPFQPTRRRDNLGARGGAGHCRDRTAGPPGGAAAGGG